MPRGAYDAAEHREAQNPTAAKPNSNSSKPNVGMNEYATDTMNAVKTRKYAARDTAPYIADALAPYSTVTDLARLRGWSRSVPFSTATW